MDSIVVLCSARASFYFKEHTQIRTKYYYYYIIIYHDNKIHYVNIR